MMTQVWFNKDSLFGGETFECMQDSNELFVRKGDTFRVEKRSEPIELIPHPDNQGGWLHDKNDPVELELVSESDNRRLFAFDVRVAQGQKRFFFLQREDLSTVFLERNPDEGDEQNGGSATIRR